MQRGAGATATLIAVLSASLLGVPSARADECGSFKRAEHDLSVRLRVGGKKRDRPRVRISVRNRGRSHEQGATVRLASVETDEELWTATIDLRRGKQRTFRMEIDRPVDTFRIVAAASLAEGTLDCKPGDDEDRDEIDPGMPADGDVTRGAEVYAPLCSVCHGADGRGGTVDEDIAHESWQDVWEAFREGEDGMPAFDDLGKRDAKDVVAYLRSPPAPDAPPDPDPDPEPEPDPDPPAPTYTTDVKPILDRSCTFCHRTGFAAVVLDSYATVSADPTVWLASIVAGRMPQRASFPSEDIDTIQAWIDAGALE